MFFISIDVCDTYIIRIVNTNSFILGYARGVKKKRHKVLFRHSAGERKPLSLSAKLSVVPTRLNLSGRDMRKPAL